MSKRLAVLILAAVPLAAVAATESYTFDPFHTTCRSRSTTSVYR